MALSTREQRTLAAIEDDMARTAPGLAATLRAFPPAVTPPPPPPPPPAERGRPLGRTAWRRMRPRWVLAGAVSAALLTTAVIAPGTGRPCPGVGVQQVTAGAAAPAPPPAGHDRPQAGGGCR